MTNKDTNKNDQDASLQDTLEELESIVGWFDTQEKPDVEAGLKKVKRGVSLIKSSKSKFRELENEFENVKEELNDANES
jgi:exonuclease VII small subunit